MTNDELLAKLLDNSLTEAEQQELSARTAASPQFAEEVREFLAVEEALQKTKPVLQPKIPGQLIDLVEHTVASSVAAGSTIATVASTTSRFSPSLRILGGLTTVCIGAGVLWYLSLSSNTVVPQPLSQSPAYEQPTIGTTPAPIPPAQTPAETHLQDDAASAPDQQQGNSVATSAAHGSLTQQQASPLSDNTANIGTTTPTDDKQSVEMLATDQKNKVRKELSKAMADYEKYKAAGDAVHTMLKATDIGLYQITLENFESSRVYLDEALSLARQLKLGENEAIILGQIGLLEEARGAHQQAVKLIEECINTLRKLDSPDLQRWQDELKNLQVK